MVSKNKNTDEVYGTLKFGILPMLISFVCILASSFFAYILITGLGIDDQGEVIAVGLMLLFFGFFSIYTTTEIIRVKGEYDSEIIFFHTPWTGSKKEKWGDLIEVYPNNKCSWYKLTFESGAVIRLSTMIGGHDEVLSFLRRRGWRIQTIQSS